MLIQVLHMQAHCSFQQSRFEPAPYAFMLPPSHPLVLMRPSLFWDVTRRSLIIDVSGEHIRPIFKGQVVAKIGSYR